MRKKRRKRGGEKRFDVRLARVLGVMRKEGIDFRAAPIELPECTVIPRVRPVDVRGARAGREVVERDGE